MNNKEVILKQQDLTKANINSVVNSLVKEIEEGNLNPLEVVIKTKYLKAIADSTIAKITPAAINEAEKYNKQDAIMLNSKFSKRSGYDILNYESDEEYARLKNELEKRKAILKDAYKAQQKGTQILDENGEVIQPPLVKSHIRDSISVSFS